MADSGGGMDEAVADSASRPSSPHAALRREAWATLTVARLLVEANGGHLSVASGREGTVVTLSLPRADRVTGVCRYEAAVS